jgi:hypothetical protein
MQKLNKNHGKGKTVAIIISLTCSIVFLGFGCGMGFDSSSWIGELGNKSNSSTGILPQLGEEPLPDILANSKTVSVVNFDTVLESMIAQTGQMPSAQTLTRFRNLIGLFSETGAVTTVNSSALLATATIAGEICNDLMMTEYAAGTPSANRRFFTMVSTDGNGRASTVLTANVQADVVRRMARSFWQRNEDAEELAMINAGVAEIIAAEPNITVRKAGLFMCSAMLSSVSAIEI